MPPWSFHPAVRTFGSRNADEEDAATAKCLPNIGDFCLAQGEQTLTMDTLETGLFM